MVVLSKSHSPNRLFWRNSALALIAVLCVFAAVLLIVSNQLRLDLRERVIQREARSLMPLVQYQVNGVFDDTGDIDLETGLIFALLETANIDGVLGVQLFDGLGNSRYVLPETEVNVEISGEALRKANSFEPLAVFIEDAIGNDRFSGLLGEENVVDAVPVLEIYIPQSLGDEVEIVGISRYVFDGRETAEVLKSINDDVRWQGIVAFCSGSLLIMGIFLVATRRLRKAYESLDSYANRLVKANEELESIAKTAAIGSVASHLIHGLKNPLAGLQNYLEAADVELDDDDRKDAQEAGKRMQSLINEVVEVIRSNADEDSYEVGLDDMVSVLAKKHSNIARQKDVSLRVVKVGDFDLESKVANIALLIASNLIQNAIDATPRDGSVLVNLVVENERVDVLVEDTGSGFRSLDDGQMFKPVQSSKADGAGIGLAISSQLAKSIDASIEVVSTGECGTKMKLSVPAMRNVEVKFN